MFFIGIRTEFLYNSKIWENFVVRGENEREETTTSASRRRRGKLCRREVTAVCDNGEVCDDGTGR